MPQTPSLAEAAITKAIQCQLKCARVTTCKLKEAHSVPPGHSCHKNIMQGARNLMLEWEKRFMRAGERRVNNSLRLGTQEGTYHGGISLWAFCSHEVPGQSKRSSIYPILKLAVNEPLSGHPLAFVWD